MGWEGESVAKRPIRISSGKGSSLDENRNNTSARKKPGVSTPARSKHKCHPERRLFAPAKNRSRRACGCFLHLPATVPSVNLNPAQQDRPIASANESITLANKVKNSTAEALTGFRGPSPTHLFSEPAGTAKKGLLSNPNKTRHNANHPLGAKFLRKAVALLIVQSAEKCLMGYRFS
jgi:hypothetical protein